MSEHTDLVVTAVTDCHIGRLSELLEFQGIRTAKVGVPPDWKKGIAFDYFVRSLRKMMGEVEKLTGRSADMELARKYFSETNRINAAFRRINELRKRPDQTIAFKDYMRLQHLSFIVGDTGLTASLLERLCDKLERARTTNHGAPRLIVIGRVIAIGDYQLISLIDRCGAVVAAEMLDEGIRVSEKDVELEGDPAAELRPQPLSGQDPDRHLPARLAHPHGQAQRAHRGMPCRRRDLVPSSPLTRSTTWSTPAWQTSSGNWASRCCVWRRTTPTRGRSSAWQRSRWKISSADCAEAEIAKPFCYNRRKEYMDFKTAAINYGDGVTDAMEERGINEDDIRAVLEYAESEGKKLYVEGEEHFLARKRIGNFSAYVEYSLNGDSVEVLNVYSHVVMLSEDQ